MGICCSNDRSKIDKQREKIRKKTEIDFLAHGHDVMSADEGQAAALAEGKVSPDHLVVMVNGILGSASDWRFAAQQFVKLLPEKVIVRCSKCNPTKLTFDGVDFMAERLADEVLSVVSHRPGLQKISFICHSLGGLVARYAIGRLYEPLSDCKENSSYTFERHGGDCKDRIAGLEPMNFITIATPHLGSCWHKQLPCLCGIPFLEKDVAQNAHLIAGRSGEHVFLKDKDEGKTPLLVRMVSDSSALRSFKQRVAYTNVCSDHIVGRSTSSIRRRHEHPKADLEFHKRYPHIVYVEQETLRDTGCNKASSCVESQIMDFEEEMIRGLNQVPWKRVDVKLRKSMQQFFAHCTIQVTAYWLNSDGADVILHIIDNFLL